MDMDTYQARLSGVAEEVRGPTGSRSSHAIGLTAEESASLLRIVSLGTLTSRHYEIFQWLRGEMQELLPHDILLAAWGDFRRRELEFDVISALPGVRTAQAARCRVDDLIHAGHAEWVAAGRRPVLLDLTNFRAPHACACPVHVAMRNMRSAVVHGVRDRRVGHESVYMALHSQPLGKTPRGDGFKFLVDCLIAQIDVAFRRVAAFPREAAKLPRQPDAEGGELSRREQEILGWLCRGATNADIGAALAISPHTVKNHLQRIFRKIGVHNRTQAVARYNEVIRDIP
jgi:transcriptional regulator EpsA